MATPFIAGNKRICKLFKKIFKKFEKSTCIYFEFEII